MKKQFTVGIFGLALILLLALIGCDIGEEDDELKLEKVGTNEVRDKTFYMGNLYKTVFNANLNFETLSWENGAWVLKENGSYGYNSETKTVTVFVNKIMWKDAQGKSTSMTESQAQNAAAAEIDAEIKEMKKQPLWLVAAVALFEAGDLDLDVYGFDHNAYDSTGGELYLIVFLQSHQTQIKPGIDARLSADNITTHDQLFDFMVKTMFEDDIGITTVAGYKNYLREQIASAFIPRAFEYNITGDGSLLGQEVLRAGKGTDHLKGNNYSYNGTAYTFAATGNTYSFTQNGVNFTGAYTYDSTLTTVRLRPATIGGETITVYYNNSPVSGTGIFSTVAEHKAALTNSTFHVEEFTYNPITKTLSRTYSGGYSAMASTTTDALKFSVRPSLFSISR
jgi:hypothetical protein